MRPQHADRAPGRRGGTAVWRDDRARVDRRRSREAAALRPALGLERPGHDAEGRTASVRAAHRAIGGGAARASAPAELARALSDGRAPLTRQKVQYRMKRAARRAQAALKACTCCVTRSARTWRCVAHRRARFRNSPAISELGMTQRYMHLSPAALDAAIRLLDRRGRTAWRHLETGRVAEW